MTGTVAAAPLGDDRRYTGEGARWDERTGLLYWVDVWAGHVLATSPSGRTRIVWATMPPVGFVAPVADGLLVGAGLGLFVIDRAAARQVAEVTGAPPGSRINDGAVDAAGRLWFGTVTPSGVDSRLHRFDGAGVSVELEGLRVANGVGWAPDGSRMFLADTGTGVIHAAPYDLATGRAGAFRPWSYRAPGAPDGLCVAPDGAVWVAEIFTGRVVELVDGSPRRQVAVPCPRVTSVALAGNRAYVTTGRKDLDAAQLLEFPHSGSIFVADL